MPSISTRCSSSKCKTIGQCSPGLKKTTETMRDQIAMFKRKIDSNRNAIATQREEYHKECKALGVKGEHIHMEIPRLVTHLPEIFGKVEKLIREWVPAVL
jgi:hypothetical protein